MKDVDTYTLDILAFGAHADDVEIGMGGTIAKHAAIGKKIGICDLTKAELSSNGTVERRLKEANHSATILGVIVRESLNMPDRGLLLKEDYINQIVTIIRRYKPRVVFAPYFEDRHPDHGSCARLVGEAVFSAGIKNYKTGNSLTSHRVTNLYYYMINGFHKPDIVIDISNHMKVKMAALRAYESQFVKENGAVDTPLVNGYLETVEARERLFGKEVGTQFAEGFKTTKPFLVQNDLLGEN